MSLLISDFEVDYDENDIPIGPGEKVEVTATADTKPLYVKDLLSGHWLLDQKGYRTVVPDFQTGAWSLVLPWPLTECQPTTVKWTITRADGAQYYGQVPEGVTGPVTILDLLNLYGWGLVSSVVTPVLAIQGPNPFNPVTTSTTAPVAGAADPIPGAPVGWAQVEINGTPQWVPYW